MSREIELQVAVRDVERRWQQTGELLDALGARLKTVSEERDLLAQTDVVLRALFKQKTQDAFKEVEKLLLGGLQTVFGDEWTNVRIDCSMKHGRLWVELILANGQIEAPPLDNFGGGPVSLVAFLLRVLVLRRAKLAPVILLDESFAGVATKFVPDLSRFLRLLVDKLGMTILFVTHQPLFAEHATRVYVAEKIGGPDGHTTFKEQTNGHGH